MNRAKQPSSSDRQARATTRRRFLQTATGAAACVALLPPDEIPAQVTNPGPLLSTIQLGSQAVTRLIIGGNPIYGYSHFNRHFSEAMKGWHTPDRVAELLQHAETQGINTWQNSYSERTLADLDRHRAHGGHLQWLCLGQPNWDENPQLIDQAAKRKPLGIAPHGALAERLHRAGKLSLLTDLLKRIRDAGVLVGLSAHNPALIELAEDQRWDVDYYMCCLYYLSRPRAEFQKLLGEELPLGEIYLPGDPPRMFKVIQKTRKPCLAYKVLAAGRRVENAAQVKQSFETVFANIKPIDAVIVGMSQQFGDQVGENSTLVRRLLSETLKR